MTQKSHETISRPTTSIEKKGKGKRPFVLLDREDLADRGVQSLVMTVDN